MPHWVGESNTSASRETLHTNEGIRFIEDNADRPFFLYQSSYTPHGPYQPPPVKSWSVTTVLRWITANTARL